MPDYTIENDLKLKGFNLVCGVDEAGRGPLAGPVCAAAVILPDNCEIDGLNDSKKLTEKKREALYDLIVQKAIDYSVVYVESSRIDKINILNATFEAMTKAVEKLKTTPDFVLIDGNKTPGQLQIPCQAVVKGDSKSMSIAAASIIAKVTRDRLMVELDKKYPFYMFAKHKGYGTKLHYEKIREFGICEIHRKTYLKNII